MSFRKIIFGVWVVVLFTTPGAPLPLLHPSANGDTTAIIMRFGGDCLLAEHYEQAVGEERDVAFRNFDLFRTADVSMVNLECPVTTRGTRSVKPFTFRMNPLFLPILKDAGIGLVNIANNHIHDFGDIGLFDTVHYLDSVGIRYVGAGRNHKEAHTPVILEIKGRRIGFLGYYGGSEAPAAVGKKAGVAKRDPALISRDIQELKAAAVDYIVVNLHWGTEKAAYPDNWQIQLARNIIDAGADAIIGHHPHVLQGIEKYKHGVIVYSLGNLIFGGNSRSGYDTGIFEIRLQQGRIEYEFIPVRINAWNATVLDGKPADSLKVHVDSLSRIFPSSIFNH